LRVLRPLEWWFLLVLVLYGLRTHERLSANTRLVFGPTLNGNSLSDHDFTASVDGKPIRKGDLIPIGWHKFTVSHPKAEPFFTNLFVWYGEKDLGEVALKRSMGILSVEANPPANIWIFTGPELSTPL